MALTLRGALAFHRGRAADRERLSVKGWITENYVSSYRKWLDYVHGRRSVPDAVVQAIAWVHAQITDRPLELRVHRMGFGTVRYAGIVPVRKHRHRAPRKAPDK